ncbi:mannose-1-phosphate guanylyltransferase [Pontixanthobacter aestiaquae]|uniref:mannose-1-phosphate guanylyltransferase n=1 Tax=Pontixanthobacter aestiaquae TaxID=1509367 RepID=A0A844Z1Z4_9SPHN|nr:mannose-1-phosphate guanylyltransferase [Pontixanthobacter aestiaquae]MDN3646278.1 mannose-1-phosphate guanylyltransferase [Pontixanthobacter aestiaquae]MXO82731.1 NTP transferase domain-containing protein [Pontixanthobacter aestiaquae]
MIHPVILCGGSGTRLWPLSRADKPKPFLPLIGTRSLFEQTLDRCSKDVLFAAPAVVTGKKHLAHVEKQLGRADGASIIVEPIGKNTAPAIALAAMRLPEDAVMLVCPSDHYIEDAGAFQSAAETASALADQGFLVSFGIEATTPETGYGYIKRGEELGGGHAVERFVEKPDLATAQRFLADGSYSWNGGIFAFKAGVFLAELTNHRPQMMDALRASVETGREDGQRFHPDAARFAQIDGDSIDYAIMETTERAAMVPVSMGWSDIGNWNALREARGSDGLGNSVKGKAELVDCTNVMVHSDGPRVSAVGLDDVIIVVDGDDVLVTTAAGTQKVGTLKGAKSQ